MIKNHGSNRLGRTSEHRRALMRNMATSLFLHEKVSTTIAKAKALRPFAERLITRAKRGEYLKVRSEIKDRVAYKKLFEVLAKRYENRPGGYTQVLRLGTRSGDNASLGMLKLV